MSQPLSIEEIRKLSKLANLPLTPQEEEAFTRQVSNILSSVEAVQSLPIKGVAPTNQVTRKSNEFREDTVAQPLTQDAVLKMAPKTHKGYILVPAVINHDNG